jgi:TetR/AcrR family transcriptional repressor for divergent bdcA
MDTSLPPKQAIELALRRSARMQTAPAHPPGCLIARGASNCSPENRHIETFLMSERARNRQAIEAQLARAVAGGELPSTAGTAMLAGVFSTFLVGIASEARDGAPWEVIDAAITGLMRLWDNAARQAQG